MLLGVHPGTRQTSVGNDAWSPSEVSRVDCDWRLWDSFHLINIIPPSKLESTLGYIRLLDLFLSYGGICCTITSRENLDLARWSFV